MFCPNCSNDKYHVIKVYRERTYDPVAKKMRYSATKDVRKVVCRKCDYVFFTETYQILDKIHEDNQQ